MSEQPPSRTGAHRPRRSALADAVPAVLVVLAVVAVALGVWALNRTTASTVSGGPADSAAATPSSSGSVTSKPTAQVTGTVDRAVGLSVLNSTGVPGLAGSAARTLTGAGWTVRDLGNLRSAHPPTTVYYRRADLRATAAAVAADLGPGVGVKLSTKFAGAGVTVVVGQDFSR